MTTKNETELVSARTASKIMHMGYDKFRNQLKSGKLKLNFSRRGNVHLFYKKEVEELFKNSFETISNEGQRE